MPKNTIAPHFWAIGFMLTPLKEGDRMEDDEYCPENTEMEFYLRYQGPLESCGNNSTRVKEKEHIRKTLSPQIRDLWRTDPNLKHITEDKIRRGEWAGGRIKEFTTSNFLSSFAYIRLKCNDYIPLVTHQLNAHCHLRIIFLRREGPGSVVRQGGDLDNRLKTLFDGLRIPNNEDEVPENTGMASQVYCLLEDDRLITKFSIETGRLYGPLDETMSENDVSLLLHVKMRFFDVNKTNIALFGS